MDVSSYIREESNHSRLLAHMQAVREFWRTICAIKEALESDDLHYFIQLWGEVPKDAQIALWRAPTNRGKENGGIWTTQERAKMRQAWSL